MTREQPETLQEAGERLHTALLRLLVVALYIPVVRPLLRYLTRRLPA